MNVEQLVRSAWRRIPREWVVKASFRDPATGTVAADVEVVVVPASGSPADGFETRATIRDTARRILVRSVDLAGFVPAANHEITLGAAVLSVLAVSPVPELTPVFYRLIAQR